MLRMVVLPFGVLLLRYNTTFLHRKVADVTLHFVKKVSSFDNKPNLKHRFSVPKLSIFKGKSMSHEKVVALYSYETSTPEDLDFEQGDVITVLSKGMRKNQILN